MGLFDENSNPLEASSPEDVPSTVSASASPFPAQPSQRRPIAIVDYNAHWPSIYEAEKQRVMAALQKAGIPERITAVEHIGSTSVPGLGAKPVVDLMIGVREQADLNTFPAAALTELGYVHRPFSPSTPPIPTPRRLLFSKYVAPATNVHVFVYGGIRWRGHLAVRDHLRGNPKAAASYEHFKRVFAAQHANDIAAYGKAKRPFLDSLEHLALGQHPAKKDMTQHAITPTDANVRSASAQQPLFLGDPAGWPVGVWYIDQPPNGWFISPDQNPMQGSTVGQFAQYDGSRWTVYGLGDPSTGSNYPPDAVTGVVYSFEVLKSDGTSYTVVATPNGYTNYDPPPNAITVTQDTGNVLVFYNNDGSSWDFSAYPVSGLGSDSAWDWGPPPDDSPPEDEGGFYDNPYGSR